MSSSSSINIFGYLLVLFIAFCGQHGQHMANAAAVMSVDLGTEWMKVGVVSPGVPMEIALNRESKRKTPAILSFRNGIRTFGEDAVTVGIREPSLAYGYLLDLLGKTIDNPTVELYRQRFPYYNIIGDPKRNTVVFKRDETEQYTIEELIAQILVKAKEFAQESTQQPITECVLTVPGYFGQAEREALLTAAQLANLKVLQLINDYAAVALNYGVFHRGELNETAQYYIFYDMGAYKTSAALVSYQLVKDKVTKETNPVVQVLGVGFDRTLGGLEVQLRLRDYLAAEFNALKKTKTDVTTSPRALAKLFKEAGRVKNVLSANNDHYAQIENLIDDQDFKVQVTREKLEELCADLWPRVARPLEQALATSGLSLDVVSQVIIFGGGTRVPRVQEAIQQLIKQKLGKNLNADEAAAMGAVYKAADLSSGFKVKKFIVKDATVYPLQVSFERAPGDGSEVKQVKRVLFAAMYPYPQKKVITFNKHTDDFEFYVHYGDLEKLYNPWEVAAIGSLNITTVELKKVKQLLEQTKNEVVEAKGIKVYFYLDDSGIFRCTGVEYIYDKQQLEDYNDANDDDEDSTLAKLGSTISKLFAKDDDHKEDGSAKKEADSNNNADEATRQENEQKNVNEKSEEENKDNDNDSTNNPPNDEANKEEADKQQTSGTASKQKNDTIKLVTIKKPVEHSISTQYTVPLSGTAYDESAKKLQEINSAEDKRNRLESAFNTLEAHVIDVQQKLEEETYASCATSDEKEKLLAECSTISDWLYEDPENPTAELYENKLKELRKISNVFLSRHWEHEERPEAVKALKGMIEGAQKFLASAKNLTKDTNPEKDVFTPVEIESLSKVIDETADWLKKETKAQEELKRHEDVRLTVKDMTDKMALLDREVKYLVNKMKSWKPKVKPTKKDKKKTTKTKDTTSSSNETLPEETGSGQQEQETNEPEPVVKENEEATPNNNSNDDEPQIEEPTDDGGESVEDVDDEAVTPSPVKNEEPTPHSEL